MTGSYDQKYAPRDAYSVTDLGGGIELESSTKIKFTVNRAQKMLDQYELYSPDRQLRQAHVDYLVKSAIRGTFHWEWVDIMIASCKDKIYRMNGQHTSWLRLECSTQGILDCDPMVNLLQYKCATMNDVRTLYSSIDRHAVRTKAHVLSSILFDTPEFEGVSKKELGLITTGLSQWIYGANTSKHTVKSDGNELAYLLMTDYYETAKRTITILRQCPKENKHMRRGPVIAAIMATCDKAPQKALEFWKMVALGVGEEIKTANHPAKRLQVALLTTSVQSAIRKDAKTVSGETMYRWCLTCWKAWREGRELQYVRNVDKRPKIR